MINVAQSFLPSIGEGTHILEIACNNKWITTRGELVL